MKNKIILKPRSELPLKTDSANLFLEIVTIISVFIFTITLTGYLLINHAAQNWDRDIAEGLTVQILPSEQALEKAENDLRTNKVVHFFENLPQVEKVVLLQDKKVEKLLKPWMGENVDLKLLPVPKLLDVKLKQGTDFDFGQVTQQLKQIAPYASLDSHRMWLAKLLKFAASVKFLTFSILMMILGVSAFSIFYATRMSLGIYGNVIEILHIMGATDSYVARQYAVRSFWIGFAAGLIGMLLAYGFLSFISHSAQGINTALIGQVSLDIKDYMTIFSLPLWTSVLSMLTAYLTVKRTLGKIV